MSDNIPVQEIVIIRRKSGDGDDGHHGGMWKIAFADFMTAMMAFFLVMWLINATDDKKKEEIATYFNPIKLPDQQKTQKALQTSDSSGGENQVASKPRNNPSGEKQMGSGEEAAGKEAKKADENLFADPYGILSKLATQVVRVPSSGEAGVRMDGKAPSSGGVAFRDPFDPDFRKRSSRDAQVEVPASARDVVPDADSSEETPSPLAQDITDGPGDAPLVAAKPAPIPPAATGEPQPKPDAEIAKPAPNASPAEAAKLASADPAGSPNKPAAQAGDGGSQGSDGAAAQVKASQLDAEIKDALRQAGIADLPDIKVARTSEGLLISLTDKLNYEMFGSASAQPRPELVVAMEKIGKLLQSRSEKVVIRGHTDARPFRSGTYDNWRLSSDRANIAHFMLARGGLQESRIEKIEGHADKDLKVPGDPKAAANRRIEILLRQPMS